jgi:tRNA(fMet)-specific endonuclease VapC
VNWLLDTNVLVHALNGVEPVRSRLNHLAPGDRVLTSILVVAELLYGVERSARREANLRHLEALLDQLDIAPVTRETARHFGRIKADLQRRGFTRGDVDLLLAATALELDAVLVTDDQALHDGRVAGLHVENWVARGS